jgi:hypothetical protein
MFVNTDNGVLPMCEQKTTSEGETLLILKSKPTTFYQPLANDNSRRTTVTSGDKLNIPAVVTKLCSQSTFLLVTT